MTYKDYIFTGNGNVFIRYKKHYGTDLLEDIEKLTNNESSITSLNIIRQLASIMFTSKKVGIGQTEQSINEFNEDSVVKSFLLEADFIHDLMKELFGDNIFENKENEDNKIKK